MINIWMDGACEPVNPGGTAGWGYVVFKDDQRVHEDYGFIPASPDTSNNVAEYTASLKAIEWIIEQGFSNENIKFFSDSRLVVEQMSGRWRIKQGRYVPYAHKLRELIKQVKKLNFQWVPREQNSIADELSKKALKEQNVQFRIQPGD